MKLVVQRVKEAEVRVHGEVVGRVARSPVVLRSGRDSDGPPLFGQARIDLDGVKFEAEFQ